MQFERVIRKLFIDACVMCNYVLTFPNVTAHAQTVLEKMKV